MQPAARQPMNATENLDPGWKQQQGPFSSGVTIRQPGRDHHRARTEFLVADFVFDKCVFAEK